jgi:drug/metabolite transporter (DMT)-like permease
VHSLPAQGSSSLNLTDLGMLLVVLIWGGNLTITRGIFPFIAPLPFLAIRFGLATILLLAVLYGTGGDLALEPSLRWRVLWLGLIGNTLYQFLFQIGLSLTSATHTALLLATVPIWLALIGTVRGTEKPSRAAWVGVLISFAGIALVLTGRGSAPLPMMVVGDLLVLASAFCWAIYTLGAQPLLARYSALKATTLTMLGGTPVLLLAGLPGLLSLQWGTIPLHGWAGVLYSSVLSIVLAYVIWYSSVQRVGAVRTGIYGNLVPIVGVLIAWGFGGEQIGFPQIAGAAAILVGIWLTRK